MVLNSKEKTSMNLEELLRYKRLPKKDLLTYDVLSKLFMKYKSLLKERERDKTFWEATHENIRIAYSNLDRLVEKRTAKLKKVNEQLKTEITNREKTEEKLKEYSENLEKMVEERTRELQDARDELVRKEKLAVLGQLAGGIGHELRNPLGAIKNAAYFLNMAVEEPETDVKEALEILENDVGRCEKIIGNLLDYARPKPPVKQKSDINEVILKALSHITVPENVEIMNQRGKKTGDILADPDQLEQAFGNIILNGIQAMQEGGQLVIKSEVTDPGLIAVSVSDTGVGIPRDDIKKIFEPLFTTKAKGIGLGLALTKTLVEGNGGVIEVESEESKGSTFTVRLPVSEKEN